MVCLSTPCSLSPHLSEAGAHSQGHSLLPWQMHNAGVWARWGWGAGGSWNRTQAMAQWDMGCSRTHWGVPSSVASLCPQHEALLSVLMPCTMCQTCPAELPVKCMDLCHFWATTALSSQVCHWYALPIQKGVLNRFEFKHKLVSGLVFTQKLLLLITLHR